MNIKFDELAKQVLSRAGVIKVRSVLNSTLWACLIVSPLSWIAAWMMRETEAFMLLVGCGIAPIAVFVAQTVFFSLKEPSRLQSEEYQLREQELNILERKGVGVVENPGILVEISDTDQKQIQRKG